MDKKRFELNAQLAQMLKGGVIMDVVSVEHAVIAQEAGAVAVMALERVPADIRRQGGVARMSDPGLIKAIKSAVTIPVMAKARIGHFVEAQVLQALKIDYIDESEVLTPADEECHIDKSTFTIPFVCGARNLGEALRRISEGAAMIRTKGEAGTGNVVEAVRHMRTMNREIRQLLNMPVEEVVEEEWSPVVVRGEEWIPNPITVEDAIRHLREVDKDFVLFKNSRSGKISLIHHRPDGNFGFVEAD